MTDGSNAIEFSFDREDPGQRSAPMTLPPLPVERPFLAVEVLATPEDLRRALDAAETVTYHWTIESDELRWSGNMAAVLKCHPAHSPTGRAYAGLLDPENMMSRYDSVMLSQTTDEGSGVPFQIEYLLRPDGRESEAMWVEDHGRWFAGPDGRPAHVFGAIRRVDERHNRDEHLNFLGNCDPLTGLMNRGRLGEVLAETIATASREHSSCAFLIAAVNNMSIVNEAYGFEVADDVIAALARRLRNVVRTGDAIARYSGSKFGIILNNCGEEDLAVAIDRFMNIARESVIETDLGPVWAMLSIGTVMLPRHADTADLAMARAEEALTEARRLPSDGGIVYQPSLQRNAERSINARCATEIVKCLKEEQFKLAFQPVVDAKTHDLVMHEALLRMVDTDGELIAAAHLIPVAEKLGLVRLIDRKVAHMAIAKLHDYPQAHLTMNVSGATATDPRWFEQLTGIIAANEQVAHRLTVEITETVALGNVKQTFSFVEALRNHGCSVAIDDFGAGFTSFRNLRDLPVNIIKLDGTFCRNLSTNTANQYLVRTLIDLGHKFNLKVIGEWVETEEDRDILAACGVDYLQGNLFGAASLNLPWEKSGDSSFGSFAMFLPERAAIQGNESPLIHRAMDKDINDGIIDTGGGAISDEGVYEPVPLSSQAEALHLEMHPVEAPQTAAEQAEKHEASAAEPPVPLIEDMPAPDQANKNLSRLRAVLAELESHFPREPQASPELQALAG